MHLQPSEYEKPKVSEDDEDLCQIDQITNERSLPSHRQCYDEDRISGPQANGNMLIGGVMETQVSSAAMQRQQECLLNLGKAWLANEEEDDLSAVAQDIPNEEQSEQLGVTLSRESI